MSARGVVSSASVGTSASSFSPMTGRRSVALFNSLAWLATAGLAGLAGCGSCASGVPERTITEKDTVEVDGGVARAVNGAWSIRLDDPDWREVAAPARQQAKPNVDRWFVHAGTLASLTIACDRGIPGPTVASLEASARAAAQATGRSLTEFQAIQVSGEYASGVVATARAAARGVATRHVMGRFMLLDTTCELQAWVAATAGDAAADSLRRLVERFSGKSPSVLRELAALSRVLKDHLGADASREDTVRLLAKGLIRLSDPELAERFKLRLKLLSVLSPTECANLIRQVNLDMDALLARLSDEDAVRWVQLSRLAVERSQGEAPDVAEPPTLGSLVAGNPELSSALATIKRISESSPGALCDAEKRRISIALALPAERRLPILRWWLSGH